MKNYQKLKTKLLKNKKVKQEYDKLEPEYSLIKQIIEKRIQQKLTQKQLARKIGTKQSAISRLESGSYNPSLAFLQKIAKGLNSKITVSLS